MFTVETRNSRELSGKFSVMADLLPFQVVSTSPLPAVVPTSGFTAVIEFNQPVSPSGLTGLVSFKGTFPSQPGPTPKIDPADPKRVLVDVTGADFVAGVPYLGVVKKGLAAAPPSTDTLAADVRWAVRTGPEQVGVGYPLFPFVTQPVVASAPASSIAYVLQRSSDSAPPMAARYEDGKGFVEAVDVTGGIDVVPPTGAQSLATCGSGEAFALFHGRTKAEVMAATTISHVYVARRPAAAAAQWGAPELLHDGATPGDLQIVSDSSCDAMAFWTESVDPGGYRVMRARIPSGQLAEAPVELGTSPTIPSLSAAATSTGDVTACWRVQTKPLRCAMGKMSASWPPAQDVPLSPPSPGIPTLHVPDKGTSLVVTYQDLASQWIAQRYTEAMGWESAYTFPVVANGTPVAPVGQVDASGDAVFIVYDPSTKQLASATCVLGSWSQIAFPATPSAGRVVMAGGARTQATAYYRAGTGTMTDIYRARFDGAQWLDEGKVVSSSFSLGVTSAQLVASQVNQAPLVLYQEEASTLLGTLFVYRGQ